MDFVTNICLKSCREIFIISPSTTEWHVLYQIFATATTIVPDLSSVRQGNTRYWARYCLDKILFASVVIVCFSISVFGHRDSLSDPDTTTRIWFRSLDLWVRTWTCKISIVDNSVGSYMWFCIVEGCPMCSSGLAKSGVYLPISFSANGFRLSVMIGCGLRVITRS